MDEQSSPVIPEVPATANVAATVKPLTMMMMMMMWVENLAPEMYVHFPVLLIDYLSILISILCI